MRLMIFALTVLLGIWHSAFSQDSIYIDVGSPGVKKIKLSPINFINHMSHAVPEPQIRVYEKKLEKLLLLTKWFEIENSDKKVDYYIKGKFYKSDDEIELELSLSTNTATTTKRLYPKFTSNNADGILRRFADVVLESLTGVRGPFSSKIVFIGKKRITDSPQIFTCYFDGSELQQITNNNAVNLSPAWSRDGKKISYTSYVSGKPEIYIYDFEKKKHSLFSMMPGNSSGASWSDKTIAFSSAHKAGKAYLYVKNIEGGIPRLLIGESQMELEPAFSPDGKKLAYASTKFVKPMIFVRNLETKQDTRITYAGWYNASPSWTPDGKKIAFASYDKDIDRWDIFTIMADGTKLERLTLFEGDNEKPSWAPDGRFIVFQSNRKQRSGSKNYSLHIMDKDGRYIAPVDLPLAEARLPHWSDYSSNELTSK